MTAAGKSGLVLICDDDPEALATVRRVLLAGGFPVLATTRPEEALAILAREDVRVLLSDVHMPEMDGNRLIAEARRIRPYAARMLLTGHADLTVAVRGINEGEVFRFMTKPWDPAALLRMVGDALAHSRDLELAVDSWRAAAERKRATSELEALHPGISHVDRDADGYYLTQHEGGDALDLGGLLERDDD